MIYKIILVSGVQRSDSAFYRFYFIKSYYNKCILYNIIYTEGLYKTDLNDPDNHDGVITYLEPDILECKVKWALGSITMNKASGGDGIPAELAISSPKI